jgi:methylmalonyl-CoA/ethylmalonyl-CoA epimerase
MPDLSLSQIGQVAVTVTNIGEAVQFYRDTLGMKYMFQTPTMAFFDCGGVRLMLSLPEGPATGNSVIYYKIADIQDAHSTLLARGVKFEAAPHLIARMPDHELWMAFFRDTAGNLLALMSEVR